MNKETLHELLQGTLLAFDGVTQEELIEKYGLYPHCARVSVKLADYLKSKEINLDVHTSGAKSNESSS